MNLKFMDFKSLLYFFVFVKCISVDSKLLASGDVIYFLVESIFYCKNEYKWDSVGRQTDLTININIR